MVFSSIVFLVYFLPIFFTIYYLVPRRLKNPVILAGSILFYAWGGPKFIFVILGTTIFDFYIVRWMYYSESAKRRKLLLIASLTLNVGLLFYFKYANFFIDNINLALTASGVSPVSWLNVVLPIGISFYTFETITYVVDVYRKVHKPLDKFWDYQLYIIFFSKLIAGPIVRYHDLADQIRGRFDNDTIERKLSGFYRFIIGLSKKVLIANPVGLYADNIMSTGFTEYDTATAWLAILAYSMQIYFDFSGYSDMAIGLAKMMGFTFPENFNNPYTSKSITEFWRRWHITLGSWMKNYLYIPLGGNQVDSKIKLYFNLWIVFLASGFWHGASWNFLIWGAFHGLFLVLERAFLNELLKKVNDLIKVGLTIVIVMTGWVFFRLETFSEAIAFLGKMYLFTDGKFVAPDLATLIPLCAGFIFAVFTLIPKGEKIQSRIYHSEISMKLQILLAPLSILFFIICLAKVAGSDFNPFIYFRF